jgi:ketosteroid isomerase-like protein
VAREDVQTLKNAYDALNRGEIARALDVLDPDAEWSEHSDLPDAATYRGRDSIQSFLERYLESWEDFRQDTEDVIDSGDRVAVLLHLFARGRGSGIEVEARYAHVWTMRDGKGVRVDAYADPDEALRSISDAPAAR